jgi:chitinase
VVGYRIYRAGALVQTILATSWTDSSLTINTAYTYGIEAFDAADNTSSRVTLSTSTTADTVPPVISFTSPASGALVIRNSGVVLNASDDEAIQRVEIFRGAVLVRTLTTSPYTTTFNAVSLANGAHNITAVAYDTSNNSTQAVLPVVISNPKRGDVTNDNVINILDLSSLLSGWNSIDLNKDLDGNDLINIFDLSILLYEYGR